MGWGGRLEGGSGWGTHVNPWLIHVNVWQKPLQYCKVISLQLIKIIRWGGEERKYKQILRIKSLNVDVYILHELELLIFSNLNDLNMMMMKALLTAITTKSFFSKLFVFDF